MATALGIVCLDFVCRLLVFWMCFTCLLFVGELDVFEVFCAVGVLMVYVFEVFHVFEVV